MFEWETLTLEIVFRLVISSKKIKAASARLKLNLATCLAPRHRPRPSHRARSTSEWQHPSSQQRACVRQPPPGPWRC